MTIRPTLMELAELNALIPLATWDGARLSDADKARARAIATGIIEDAGTTFAEAAQDFLAQSDCAESDHALHGPARAWSDANRAITAAFPGVGLFVGFYADFYRPDAALFYDRNGVMRTAASA